MRLPATDPVPDHYLGLWRRTRLRSAGRIDTSTQVFWLQSRQWHVDLRIPADRPDFAGVSRLADCNAAQLHWLLGQSGFAGLTRVEGEVCEWLRQLDYRPSGERDIARMVFHGDAVEEFGLEADYDEWWEREPQGGGEVDCQVVQQDGRLASVTARAGQWLMHCRPRAMPIAAEQAAWASVQAGGASIDSLRALADFELSLAEADSGLIRLSTLPWREGQRLG
ncbi:hypothetical protein [Chitinimonas sp.]|uniref:hypothetical protein n=1 Tax=Chitinimonas sp. TaxID=1934313 RepID=UPI0035B38510